MTSSTTRIALLTLVLFAGAAISRSQTAPMMLEISSDPPGASVYLDSLFLGRSPVIVPLPASVTGGARHVVAVVGGKPGDWFSPVVTDTLSIGTPSIDARSGEAPSGEASSGEARPGTPAGAAGDTLRLHYVLPLTARISSEPPGAGVLLGDSLIGTTPLFASVPRGVTTLRLRKEGYREENVLVDPATFNYRVDLARHDSAVGVASPLAGVNSPGSTGLIIAGGISIAAGTAAALLKQEADAAYDVYQLTGDPAALDRVYKLDLGSAISLAVAEIGLGYIIFELLSR